MSIITISSSSGKISKEIGDRAAAILEYQTVGGEDLVAATSREYGISGDILTKAFSETPSPRKISLRERRRCLACLQAELARFLLADDIIYTGPIGHLLIHGVSHVLKVYIAEAVDDRAERLMDEEHVSFKKASKILARLEKDHRKWAKEAFGIDDPVPSSFDLTIELDKSDRERACEQVVKTVREKRFQSMTYSRNQMADHELAYRIKAKLADLFPEIIVQSKSGEVTINTKAHGKAREKSLQTIQERVGALEGVKELKINVREDLFRRMEGGMR